MRRMPGLVIALAAAAATLPSPVAAQLRYPPVRPGYRYAAPESDLRIAVKPKEADVYVDGYFAGKVEDYDGTFQRLHVEPGEHEIVVYLDGYRSLRQKLYLSPNATRKIEGVLERLSPSEAQEPVPVPVARPEPSSDPRDQDRPRMAPGRGPVTRRAPPRDEPRAPAPPPRPAPSAPATRSTSGALSIRVQPSGATVLIDGERWSGPESADERLIVQVPAGRHRIEVQREGFEPFSTEVEVGAEQTAPVNISLTRAR